MDGASLGARLAGALAEMRPRERDALLLYALAELSYEEIASALDVPLGTVRTWLHRARRCAQSELAEDGTSFSRHQELIRVDELDRFRDLGRGFQLRARMLGGEPRSGSKRDRCRTDARDEYGPRPFGRRGYIVIACAALVGVSAIALFVSAPWKASPGFLERAQAALAPPAGTVLHMKWELGLGSIDRTCVFSRFGPGMHFAGAA